MVNLWQNYHRLLHGSKVAYCNTIKVSHNTSSRKSHETNDAESCTKTEVSCDRRVAATGLGQEDEMSGRPPIADELQEVDEIYAMVPIQLVYCKAKEKTLIAFFNGGSNINIVHDAWAEIAGLEGIPTV